MGQRAVSLSKSAAPSLLIEGRVVPLTVRLDRRARRYIVRVDPFTGEVAVISPSAHGRSTALSFAREQAGWIAEKLAAVPPARAYADGVTIPFHGIDHIIRHRSQQRGVVSVHTPDPLGEKLPALCVSGALHHLPRRLEDWLKRESRREIGARLTIHADRLGFSPPAFGLRDPRSRWGSCTSQGNMSFSWRLILAPEFVLDYVVAHETAHLKQMNHGKSFWRLLEKLTPDVQRAENWLKRNGALLHRVGIPAAVS